MRGIKRLIGSAMLGVLALVVLYFTAPYTLLVLLSLL